MADGGKWQHGHPTVSTCSVNFVFSTLYAFNSVKKLPSLLALKTGPFEDSLVMSRGNHLMTAAVAELQHGKIICNLASMSHIHQYSAQNFVFYQAT